MPRGSHASTSVPTARENSDRRPADDLVIAGLVPMSTVDWPDHLTATVFLQGCPWNCFYCHNRALIPARTPGQVAWEEVRALLRRRRGLLDGVVLTGGEALRQDALADAAREVIDMGFQVGLHTAGPYPRRLRDMIEAGLVDWVGLDIKALPEHYGQVVGRANAAARAWESLEVLVEAADRGGPDFEVRTTVVPGDVTADDAVEVARRVHAAGARVYALQQARSEGTSGEFDVVAPGWDGMCERMAERIEALGWDRFTYRPA
ncbi:anaerobic ribonucleoside-triphosphate reductase activating protein [Actinomyces oris]|uniref:anaerobic ribonucleoside-triphosphate reductase activating protein n=1 Tax=Actinomyces oris TaxID=544580 RepID=UPI0037BE483F